MPRFLLPRYRLVLGVFGGFFLAGATRFGNFDSGLYALQRSNSMGFCALEFSRFVIIIFIGHFCNAMQYRGGCNKFGKDEQLR